MAIADAWRLTEQERLRVLGFPPRSTFHGWAAKVREKRDITLSADEMALYQKIYDAVEAYLDEIAGYKGAA